MRKASLIVLLLILGSLGTPITAAAPVEVSENSVENNPFNVPIAFTEIEDSLTVDNGLSYKVKLFKGSAGYDVFHSQNGGVLVYSQRSTVDAQSKANWKQVGTPTGLTWVQNSPTEITVTRHYTDYLGTLVDVVYHFRAGEPVKMDVEINSGKTRDYRIVWELDGITQPAATDHDKTVKFGDLESDTWIGFDWNDAYAQFGDIDVKTLSTSAQGRKLDVTFTVGQVAEGETLVLDPIIVDSYSEVNQDAAPIMNDNHPAAGGTVSANGQSFTADEKHYITSAKFYLSKGGNPTGDAYVRLYAHNGVYGVNSVPTGAALASSDSFNVSTLGGGLALISFNFTGAEQILLARNTHYCIVFECPAVGLINAANNISIGLDASAPGHDGNRVYYSAGAWGSENAHDVIFYVYGTPIIENGAVDSDATFSRDEEGWVNVTVTHTAGVANIETVDVQVNTTLDAQNFTLRWTQATDTFSELSDLDNICTLNMTRSTRINLNATTDQICFCFAITGGADGDCDVRLTTTGDGGLSDTDLHAAEFTYSTYGWDPIGDLINSAFSFFGIIDYMTQAIVYVNGIATHFAGSITSMITLITQQFRIITNVFTWVMRWVTRFTDMILTLAGYITGIFDGTGAVVTYLGNWWDFIDLASWYPLVTLVGVLMWYDSIIKRGKTQGEIQVATRDLQTIMSILSYFTAMFTLVINTVVDTTFRLFDAIT